MALTTPSLYNIKPFPSNESMTFKFNSIGGDQVTANKLEIQRTSNNTIVYNIKIDTFIFEHNLPVNTLQNGVEYKARIYTYNINNQTSQPSSWIVFKCIDRPIVNIPMINDEEVNNQTVVFEGTYLQTYDALQSYRYILYDKNQVPIKTFNELFDGLLQQEIAGLEHLETYYLELKTISTLGMEGTSGLKKFIPSYIQPRLATVVDLQNLKDKAAIQVTANIIQLIFKTSNGASPIYLDGDWIDLNNQMIYLQEGLMIDNNFTLKMWCKNVEVNKTNVKLYSPLGTFEVKYFDNRFHVYKYIKGTNIYYHIYSDEIYPISTDTVCIVLQHINNFCNIMTTIV